MALNNDDIENQDSLKGENDQSRRSLQASQETLYHHFSKIVNQWNFVEVLEEFENTFICPLKTSNPDSLEAIYNIIFANDEERFHYTLKRVCYILINNWCIARRYEYIHQLINLLIERNQNNASISLPLRRIQKWLDDFVDTQDFQDIELFLSGTPFETKQHWSHRYASYLLVNQYSKSDNSSEQREAAIKQAQQLKARFKYDLAMYTAHSQPASPIMSGETPKNPTNLGNAALNLIKRILVRHGLFDYTNLANIFRQQNKSINYENFKTNLKKYLLYGVFFDSGNLAETINDNLKKKIELLYEAYDTENVTDDLVLRTCNTIIDLFTTEDNQHPSSLFVLLLSHSENLTLALILLKVILLCGYCRAHLESQIANLIQYYGELPESECLPVIQFLEILNIALTLYTEDVHYTLVKVGEQEAETEEDSLLDTYRIFSQRKYYLNLDRANFSGTDLHGANLRNINLQSSILRYANLSEADLSEANLRDSNLSEADLRGVNLVTADLSNANFTGSNLQSADLSRANLSHIKLSKANLALARLVYANLVQTNLTHTNLENADLTGADLSYANLTSANLKGANLSQTKLTGANLSHANLTGAILLKATLCQTNLTHTELEAVDFREARLKEVNFQHAKMKNTRFGRNVGLSEETKKRLQWRGGVFEEAEGRRQEAEDRSHL
ncbi:MAG: pentapeptide repeat-containing protein [Halothece sp.]